MASDFNNIRADLQGRQAEEPSGQMMFIGLLVGVLAIGGVIGYMLLPQDSNSQVVSVAERSEPTKPKAKKLKKSELKKLRKAEMAKFRETQTQLISCASSQRHMIKVYETYNARNQSKYDAWRAAYDPAKKLSKMGEMNALEANAFMLTGGQSAVNDMFAEVQMELGAYDKKIDPIECGNLNARVQRRELDLKDAPTS